MCTCVCVCVCGVGVGVGRGVSLCMCVVYMCVMCAHTLHHNNGLNIGYPTFTFRQILILSCIIRIYFSIFFVDPINENKPQ